MISKNRVIIESMNLTISNPVSPPDPKTGFPLAVESTMIYAKLNAPPEKSMNTFANDHPFVDYLFQFKYTYGIYLNRLMRALPYPHMRMVDQLTVK